MTGRRSARRIALLLTLAVICAHGQTSVEPRSTHPLKDASLPSANLRVDTNLVLVPVTVNDLLQHPVTGLEKENFRVYDDRVEQSITSFSTEDEPIALGLVFDTSGSMKGAIPAGRRAAAEFLKLADPEDEFFLVEFDTRPRLVIPLTSDTGHISTEVMMTKSGGSTALIDGLYMAIHEIQKSRRAKKALVLISDGGENHSRYTPAEVTNVVRESDVLIYTILVPGYDADPGLMKRIAETTGAHMYEAGRYELADIAQKIAIELRNRYVLGYMPREQRRDGHYHRIEVRVVPPRGLPKLIAHWRLGYYAPSE